MNAATALARANFAYKVATNGISSGITINFTNLQDLANNPPDLVEALNQALFRGEMDSTVRDYAVNRRQRIHQHWRRGCAARCTPRQQRRNIEVQQ